MLVYSIQLILLFLSGLILKSSLYNKKKIFLIVFCLILFSVMAFRTEEVGTDTEIYCNIFENLAKNKFDSTYFKDKTMYVYAFYNILVSLISTSRNAIIISNAFIVVLLLGIFLWKMCNNHLFLSGLLFVLMFYYFGAFNTCRQYIAILLFLNSLYFLKYKRIIPFIIINLIGVFVHPSAICTFIMLPLFLFKKFEKKWVYILFIVLIIGIAIFLNYFVNLYIDFFDEYENYKTNGLLENENNGRSLILVGLNLMYLLLAFMLCKYIKDYSIFKENIILFMVYIVSIIFGFVVFRYEMLGRFNLYFTVASIAMIPILLDSFKEEKTLIFFQSIIVFIYMILFFTMLNSGYNGVLPYSHIF